MAAVQPPVNPRGVIDPEAGHQDPATSDHDSGVATATASSSTDPTKFSCLYFGYGSNLSPRTMKQRCPGALFAGLGLLRDWKWIINDTGYANIVQSPGDLVYGSLCFLSGRDEAALDESEGVPWLYEKKNLSVTRVVRAEEKDEWSEMGSVEVTTYVDVQRMAEGKVEREYIVWVSKAIQDGVQCGMPESYAEKYILPFLPAKDHDVWKQPDIVMVRTTRFGEKDAGMVPRGFASWERG